MQISHIIIQIASKAKIFPNVVFSVCKINENKFVKVSLCCTQIGEINKFTLVNLHRNCFIFECVANNVRTNLFLFSGNTIDGLIEQEDILKLNRASNVQQATTLVWEFEGGKERKKKFYGALNFFERGNFMSLCLLCISELLNVVAKKIKFHCFKNLSNESFSSSIRSLR